MLNLKNASVAILLAAIMAVMGNPVTAQDQTRFVLKLDENLISSFRSYRSLRSNVPDKFKGKISYVELQFAESKEAEPIEMDLGLTIDSGTANINLLEATIETLKTRPIRVAVSSDASTFSQIVLAYDTATSPAGSQNAASPATSSDFQNPNVVPVKPVSNQKPENRGAHFVRLGDDQFMAGTLNGFDQIDLTTQFGNVSIPMSYVVGIKFHTSSDDSAIVILTNGDSITGVPAIPVVTLLTDWGQADIDAKSIQSLTTTPEAKFAQQKTDFGVRWVLQKGDPKAPATAGIGSYR